MSKFHYVLWDVGQGLSSTVFTPEVTSIGDKVFNRRRVVQIDAGHNSETDFSPITHIVKSFNYDVIDNLVLTHPDLDHISDLPNLDELVKNNELKVSTLLRNRSFPKQVVSEEENKESQAKTVYKNLDERYTADCAVWNRLSIPDNFGGIKFDYDYLDYSDDSDINDCSILMEVQYGVLKIIIPGDITSAGFNQLVEQEKVSASSEEDIVFLVAPHHGKESADPKDILGFYKPDLVLASAASGDENTDSIYSSDLVTGYPVEGQSGDSKFITTKRGSAIMIRMIDGSKPKVSFLSHD